MNDMITLSDRNIFDAFGVAGFALYVLNYTMLTMQRIEAGCIQYFALNMAAATLVLLGLTGAFNLASALIQVFFICSSAVAILIRLRTRQRVKTQLQY